MHDLILLLEKLITPSSNVTEHREQIFLHTVMIFKAGEH